MASRPLAVEPITSEPADAPGDIVYLVESEGRVEREMLDHWLAEQGGGIASGSIQAIYYDRPREAPTSQKLIEALIGSTELGEDVWLAPVRVIWLARKRTGQHFPRWRDALLGRNPHEPSERAKARLSVAQPDRWQLVKAEPARLGDLRQ